MPFFYFRDEIEILLPSVSCLETRSRFFHKISGFETRSIFLFTESQASRRDRDFLSFNLEIRDKIENFQWNVYLSCVIQNCIFLYSTNTYFWIRKSPKYAFHHVNTKQISAPLPPPAFLLGSFSKYSQTRLFDSMKSYSGMRTIQLQYIQVNFHFCPTCLKTLC